MSLTIEYLLGISYLIWMPLTAILLAAIIWTASFETLSNATAVLGLSMLVTLAVTVVGQPSWLSVTTSMFQPSSNTLQPMALYLFSVVSLFGAYMTPYQFALYSSGAMEEEWTGRDHLTNRIVTIVGTTFGAIIAMALTAGAAIYLFPGHQSVSAFTALLQPAKDSLGLIGVGVMLFGIFMVSLAAGLEAAMSGSYAVCQYLGWDWGKKGRPATAPLFHFGVLVLIVLAVLVGETEVDPILMTTLSMAIAAVALPFNFIPLLIVANDPSFMGDQCNGILTNVASIGIVVLLTVVTLAAIPLLFLSGSL